MKPTSLRQRRRAMFLLAFMTLVINVPLLHGSWSSWRIDKQGEVTEAIITDNLVFDAKSDTPRYLLNFRFDESVDPEERSYSAPVAKEVYDSAVQTKRIEARVVPGTPSAFEVAGQQSSDVGLYLAMVANLVLAATGIFYMRTRPSKVGVAASGAAGPIGQEPATSDTVEPRALRVAAVGDVVATEDQASLLRLGTDTYQLTGTIIAVADDSIVVETGDQQVYVALEGHSNPVGYQRGARVLGRELPG